MTSRAEELAALLDDGDRSGIWYPGIHAAAELRRLASEVESLKLAEEGAKEAFGHVVQQKRDLEKALKHCEANLQSAHEIIRNHTQTNWRSQHG